MASKEWIRVSALLDIAMDAWVNHGMPAGKAGLSIPDAATHPFFEAMSALGEASHWSDEALQKARAEELKQFSKRERIYLKNRPRPWSIQKASALASSSKWPAALDDFALCVAAWVKNLKPANPLNDAVFKVRHDVGGKILNLACAVCCSGQRGATGPYELRQMLLKSHGQWCADLSISSASDYFFGSHDFGWGTWEDQWNTKSGVVMVWGDLLLKAAADQKSKKLEAPLEDDEWQSAVGTMMLNYAERAASGDDFGISEWTWAIRYPLGAMTPSQGKCFVEQQCGSRHFDKLWMCEEPKNWMRVLSVMAAKAIGPDAPQMVQLRQEQDRWLALDQALEIKNHINMEEQTALVKSRRSQSL